MTPLETKTAPWPLIVSAIHQVLATVRVPHLRRNGEPALDASGNAKQRPLRDRDVYACLPKVRHGTLHAYLHYGLIPKERQRQAALRNWLRRQLEKKQGVESLKPARKSLK